MTNPRAVRAAMALSIATTGGAMYYFLSEGGDPEKLDDNLANATEKLTQIGAKVSETSAKLADSTSSLKETVVSWTTSTNQAEQHVTAHNPAESRAEATDERPSISNTAERLDARPRDYQSNSSSKCHTCSGPRIWFFAEKLRLKRRITPYPDPPQQ